MMSGIALGLAIDAVLAIMLFAAIVVGLRVHRRLAEVRRAQSELADLVVQLDRATEKARNAVGELKHAGSEAREILTSDMARARSLADELSLIAEAGDNLATRLETRLTEAGRHIRAQDKSAPSGGRRAPTGERSAPRGEVPARSSARSAPPAEDDLGFDDAADDDLFGRDDTDVSPQEAIMAALRNVR
ncbi:hypothetical protein CCR85_05365 [Rhodothalassium salexigens]|uniref:DUF6468 domain-containing protein n=1 Tax=Rhodothalassium salexigens TaxID=1086 RepID=UPI0019112D13|nr:DUF6468 domain-containing protein [Rhodothalassium salexigens]MBK5910922.1 hypothetical protein [Rhodothalassium salexigens]MBK5919498.1 hypothetical protein [Rhodothalassium salexigens]